MKPDPSATTRVCVGRLDEIADGESREVLAGKHEIAVFRIGAQLYATDNLCTHGSGRLCDGFLEGYEIECPLHQGAFDVRSGEPVRIPAEEPLRTYAVELEDGKAYIVVDV